MSDALAPPLPPCASADLPCTTAYSLPPSPPAHDPWRWLVHTARRDSHDRVVLHHALRQLGPDLLKSLLLRHVRHCHSSRCATCAKLRTRIAAVKRRRALWRTFRTIARVAGVLALSRRRAACRVYAPGGVGYLQMEEEFEAMQREAKGATMKEGETVQREAKGVAMEKEEEAMPREAKGAAMEEGEAMQREAKMARCGPSRRS